MTTFSIIVKSQLEGAHRLDAEYYQPEYLNISSKLRANKFYKKFSEIIVDGNYGILPDSEDYIIEESNNFIYLIRGIDLRGISLTEGDLVRVPEEYLNKRAIAKEGDLLFLVKGATIDAEDSVVIVPKISKAAIFNGSIFRPIFKENIISEFIYVFMKTRYFYMQKRRFVSNVGIEYNSASEINSYDFIIPSIEFQLRIKESVLFFFDFLKESKNLYFQAEDLLLQELGLKDFKPQDDLAYFVNLSEAKSANRMDAEYFQPKYETIIARIKKRNVKPLGELVTMKKGFEPGSDEYQEEGKVFLRVSNISRIGFTDKDQKYLSNELYQQLKGGFEPKLGEILLTKDATPGIAYVLKEPVEGIIASGIMRLKIKNDIDGEYLALCVNSLVCQMQVERDAGGSIIVHWKPEQIKNLLIPILPKPTQQKIADLVCKSHEAHKKAKELLEEAKRKVEKMIEG